MKIPFVPLLNFTDHKCVWGGPHHDSTLSGTRALGGLLHSECHVLITACNYYPFIAEHFYQLPICHFVRHKMR